MAFFEMIGAKIIQGVYAMGLMVSCFVYHLRRGIRHWQGCSLLVAQ